MKLFYFIALSVLLTSCWPTSVSFRDNSMPPEWKNFFLITLDNEAPNTPLSYPANLSEQLKDGVQNNTRLLLANNQDSSQVIISGVVAQYSVDPVAIQDGDVAAQNRLTVRVNFQIDITAPEVDQKTLTATRFVDYDASTDLGIVETELLNTVNEQIVQDLINKLLSNW